MSAPVSSAPAAARPNAQKYPANHPAVIERMNPADRGDVEAVSRLHEQYLPESTVSRMGPHFVRNVYYSRLLAEGLYDCLVCRSEGRVVAFLSYADRPTDFMSRGLKSHFVAVAWNVARAVLASPKRVRDVMLVLRLMAERSPGTEDQVLKAGAAEALSMAVLPEFQNVVPTGGKSRIAVRLIEMMAEDLRQRGVREIAFYVDPANKGANLLYSAMGCKFEKIVHAGIPRHRFIYQVAPKLGTS
jgi:ribosomal protein S18 acetylase RimI-like enzyme